MHVKYELQTVEHKVGAELAGWAGHARDAASRA